MEFYSPTEFFKNREYFMSKTLFTSHNYENTKLKKTRRCIININWFYVEFNFNAIDLKLYK